MYTAVVLDRDSACRLLERVKDVVPAGWSLYCHHVTVNLGTKDRGPMKDIELGSVFEMTVVSLGSSPKAIAVAVDGVPSLNENPHITCGIAPGAKPKDSNEITDWVCASSPGRPWLMLKGTLQEVP